VNRIMIALAVLAGCNQTATDTDTPTDVVEPVVPFVDDCDTVENDTVATASPLAAGDRHTGLNLCKRELDVYALTVPSGTHVTVEISEFGGSGLGDLDLLELDAQGEVVWQSASEQAYERLAWYNPGAEPMVRYVAVDGYEKARGTYDLSVVGRDYHEGKNCDKFVDNPAESGPCNEILQFPQTNSDDEGYFVEHQAHYSNLRREVQYLVRWAARRTAEALPGSGPLAMMDMSERDGSTPGAMVNSLRHPEGTHANGNDIDIAYYQTNGDNSGREVCRSDGYFCTAEPHILDARRSVYFIAMLTRSPYIRVVGVDTMIAPMLMDAARELASEGLLDSEDVSRVDYYMAYGEGWPFHHHHLHFSWSWEDGYEPTQGCLTQPGPYPLQEVPTFLEP
jgi:hypothetical protein